MFGITGSIGGRAVGVPRRGVACLVGGVVVVMALAGTASAGEVTVDFGAVPTTLDISLQTGAPVVVSGIKFSYDTYGDPTQFCAIDNVGIYGSCLGPLMLDFQNLPASSLKSNFSVYGLSAPLSDNGLFALFFRSGNLTDIAGVPGDYTAPSGGDPNSGYVLGTLDYFGPEFDQVVMYFSVSGQIFTADTMSYFEVPEPATLALCGTGLAALAGFLRRRRLI